MQYKKLNVGSKRKTNQKQAQQIWDEITASQINSEINCINMREQMDAAFVCKHLERLLVTWFQWWIAASDSPPQILL